MRAGKPESIEEFVNVEVDGIQFYIAAELDDKSIRLDRTGWWIFGSLAVSVH